eukprot:6177859-Pyramimonas_sp.AAC.1
MTSGQSKGSRQFNALQRNGPHITPHHINTQQSHSMQVSACASYFQLVLIRSTTYLIGMTVTMTMVMTAITITMIIILMM